MKRLGLAAIIAMLPALAAQPARAQECETYRITGYVRGYGSGITFDGTSVWTRERIAAASWNVPMGSYVAVYGLGSYRVADRGSGLGPRHVDILVDSAAEAYALTGWRETCVYV